MKEGRACEGYERATVFVRHTPDNSAGYTRLRQFRSRPEYRGQSIRCNSVPEAVLLHPGLARSAFGEQCTSFWWDAYVPKADAFASQHILPAPTPQKLWCTAWADTITRMSTHSTVLRKALYALSLSCAGCQRRDEKLAREGLKYYCEALVQLGQILQNPETAVEDESLLTTCLQLAEYEVSSLSPCSPLDHVLWQADRKLSSSMDSTYPNTIAAPGIGRSMWRALIDSCN